MKNLMLIILFIIGLSIAYLREKLRRLLKIR